MKIGIIDMGTNTFHLLITEVKDDGSYRLLLKERKAVRIGKGGINEGMITKDAERRALTGLTAFKKKMDDKKVDKVYATATSAIRSAKNGQLFIEKIKNEIGIEATIISGIKEAELIYLGVNKALNLGTENALIVDIGGGSIEFILANHSNILWLRSFEMGGQRLLERFHKKDPISQEEINNLNNYLEESLAELRLKCMELAPKVMIGCSGTFETLSEIYTRHKGIAFDSTATEFPMDIMDFDRIHYLLISKNRTERLKIPGMIEMRVDMIVVASILINYLIKSLVLEELRVSAFALKEGVLFDAINKTLVSNKVISK